MSETNENAVVETTGRKNIAVTDFVKTYIDVFKANGTLKDVALKLGVKELTVQARATNLRGKDIALPYMKRKSRTSSKDVNALIADLTGVDTSMEVAKLQKARLARAEKKAANK